MTHPPSQTRPPLGRTDAHGTQDAHDEAPAVALSSAVRRALAALAEPFESEEALLARLPEALVPGLAAGCVASVDAREERPSTRTEAGATAGEPALVLEVAGPGGRVGTLALFARGGALSAEARRVAEDVCRVAERLAASRALEDALATAVRARDAFVSTVSHDLRGPLAAVQTSAELLGIMLDEGEIPEVASRPLAVVKRSTTRMKRLIQDLVDAARIESGKLACERGPVPVRSILEGAAAQVQPKLQTRGVELAVYDDSAGTSALGDAQRLQQVVETLIERGTDRGAGARRVVVRAARHADGVLVSVHDDGPPIPPADRAFLFARTDPSGAPRMPGSGLGLYLVKGILDVHGASLAVESSPDAGTTFRFVLRPYVG